MNIKVLNFETVAMCYTPYTDGINILENKANDHRETIEAIQTEAMAYMEEHKDSTDVEIQDGFQTVMNNFQQKAMMEDSNFKKFADDQQRSLIELAFKEITELVKEYSFDNNIDMVINKSEVVFFKDENSLTDEIIEVIKLKDLYTEKIPKS